LLLSLIAVARVSAADADAETAKETAATQQADEVLAGHSYHGEAFNEGPRQAAELMEGMGDVRFPTSTEAPRAQKFFEQGVAALHGFWYLEAERSFRQAAALDPEFAMAYWGMALANENNEKRARGFIAEAVERRESASRREQLLIDAAANFIGEENEEERAEKSRDRDAERKAREKRYRDYFADLEKVLDEFPDDVETKALLALEMWKANRRGVRITSYYAIDALLGQVFEANPMHPAHHYRIHLWDTRRPENALKSAGLCGPSLPAVAHMWHMPGHIYSRLHRYADAAWQQEASARVDHSHMIRTRLLPDQIHNFAHNNEWLTRNLIFLGRVDDALLQSRNLVAMPRHPKYNSIDSRGSFRYGRIRLLQTLSEFELWEQLIREADGPYLTPTRDPEWQDERLAWLAVAHRLGGEAAEARRIDRRLRGRLVELQQRELELEAIEDGDSGAASSAAETEDASANGEEPPEQDEPQQDAETQLKEVRQRIRSLQRCIALEQAAAAVAKQDARRYEERIDEAPRIDKTLRASWLAQAGNRKAAVEQLRKIVDDSPGQVRPVAVLVHTLWEDGQQDAAVKEFAALRKLAASADLETPLLARLAPVAERAGVSGDWRIAYEPPEDLGPRPQLDELGPFRWSPYEAPDWRAIDASGQEMTAADYEGKPRIVIFYLGFGCLHCVEQLTAFKPYTEKFAEAGIDIVGISTEDLANLRKGQERFDQTIPFPLYADGEQQAFKAYRCWDDFESQPLHGTFLIDAQGRVRWQDIGYEPFTDAEFLLRESRRLLALPE
jgi:peroxiredoxin